VGQDGQVVAAAPDPAAGVAGTRWERDPRVLWRRITGGVVVLGPGMDIPAAVEGVLAAEVWAGLEQARTAPDLTRLLCDQLGAELGAQVDADAVATQVAATLAELDRLGVLVAVPGDVPADVSGAAAADVQGDRP
jgi:hypothetical protein